MSVQLLIFFGCEKYCSSALDKWKVKYHDYSQSNSTKHRQTGGRQKVSLGFSDIGRGMTSSEWTDRNGEAHFDAKNGDGKVFIDSASKHKGYLSGRIVVDI